MTYKICRSLQISLEILRPSIIATQCLWNSLRRRRKPLTRTSSIPLSLKMIFFLFFCLFFPFFLWTQRAVGSLPLSYIPTTPFPAPFLTFCVPGSPYHACRKSKRKRVGAWEQVGKGNDITHQRSNNVITWKLPEKSLQSSGTVRSPVTREQVHLKSCPFGTGAWTARAGHLCNPVGNAATQWSRFSSQVIAPNWVSWVTWPLFNRLLI